MRRLYLLLTIISLVALIQFPSYAIAQGKTHTIEQFTKEADLIVIGKITHQESSWNKRKTSVDTYNTVTVDTTIKGDSAEKVLCVVVPGGKVGQSTIIVSDMPVFTIGERAVLFLTKGKDGCYRLIGGQDGKRTVLANYIVEDRQPVSVFIEKVRGNLVQLEKTKKGRVFISTLTDMGKQSPPVFRGATSGLPDLRKVSRPMYKSASTSNVTLFQEDFEAVPHLVWANDYWGVTDYKSCWGSKSAWCAGALYSPWDYYYPNNLDSWVVYGPFDLSDASTAKLSFYWWNDSEYGYDYFGWAASSDDITYDGMRTSGYSNGWQYEVLDLSPYVGDSSVWVGFNFNSDSLSIGDFEGAFIDNITVEKNTVDPPQVNSISPTSGSAGTGTRVVLKGSKFGATQGSGGVVFNGGQLAVADILSWSDTQIEAEVPSGASSGDVYVVSDNNGVGAISNPISFNVTFSYSGWRWPDSSIPVSYSINASGTPDVEDEFTAIQNSFATWSNVSTSKMAFSNEGTTTRSGTDNNDGYNTVSFDPDGSFVGQGPLAVTITRINGSYIAEQDIIINDLNAWSTSGDPLKYDLQSTVTHEVGHLLCLDDLYGDTDSLKTMYGFSGLGETKQRTLEPEDIAGITYIYYTDDKIKPSIPVSLEVTAGVERAILQWGASTDNKAVSGYNIYRAGSSGGPFVKVASTVASSLGYTDRYLMPNTPYYYVVTAVDTANNESGFSNEVSATPTTDTIAPNAPIGLLATPQDRQVLVSWSSNTEVDLAGYNIYRNTTDSPSTAIRINPNLISKTQTSYVDAGLSNGASYYYWLTAVDLAYSSNESTKSAGVSAVPVVPSGGSSGGSGGGGGGAGQSPVMAPANLKAITSAFAITLTWSGIDGASGYNIYRKEGTGGYAKLNPGLISGTTYIDATAKAGITYVYYVVAVGTDQQESGKSNEISASTGIVAGEVTFSDVPTDAWYKEYVTELVSKHIIGGYADGTFKPGKSISRAEFAKMICLAQGWQLINPPEVSFTDIKKTDWSYKYIETAKAHGVIGGYSNGLFQPGKNVTRAEVAKMIAKTLALTPGVSSLDDVSSHWAKDYIGACVEAGIIGGYSDNSFKPNNSATRAEAAKMIAGILQ